MADEIEYAPLEGPPEAPQAPPEPDLHHLHDVPVELAVEIGRTRMTIGDTLKLGPGSIVSLNRLAGEPVDLLVNGKPIAHGEVVVIDEEFGLRITDVVNTAGHAHPHDAGTLPPPRPAVDPTLLAPDPAHLAPPAPAPAAAGEPAVGDDAVAAYLRDAAGLGGGGEAAPHLGDASGLDADGARGPHLEPALDAGGVAEADELLPLDGPDGDPPYGDLHDADAPEPPPIVDAFPADDEPMGFADAADEPRAP